MRNFKLTLCYDGTRYDGWQRQGNSENTIQGRLETLLSRLLAQPIEVAGSGRTDAGVHAIGQVCSFRAETEASCETLLSDIRDRALRGVSAFSRASLLPGKDLRLPHLEQRGAERFRAPLDALLAASARSRGDARGGGKARRRA